MLTSIFCTHHKIKDKLHVNVIKNQSDNGITVMSEENDVNDKDIAKSLERWLLDSCHTLVS